MVSGRGPLQRWAVVGYGGRICTSLCNAARQKRAADADPGVLLLLAAFPHEGSVQRAKAAVCAKAALSMGGVDFRG
jgi:hypothetical protein